MIAFGIIRLSMAPLCPIFPFISDVIHRSWLLLNKLLKYYESVSLLFLVNATKSVASTIGNVVIMEMENCTFPPQYPMYHSIIKTAWQAT